MKIVLFIGSLNGGGAERMMVNLANGFTVLGFDTTLICAEFSGPFCSEINSGVKVLDLKKKSVIASLPSLVRNVKRIRPQFVLVTQSHAILAGLILKKFSREPFKLIIREATTPSEARQLKHDLKSYFIDAILMRIY